MRIIVKVGNTIQTAEGSFGPGSILDLKDGQELIDRGVADPDPEIARRAASAKADAELKAKVAADAKAKVEADAAQAKADAEAKTLADAAAVEAKRLAEEAAAAAKGAKK